MRSGRPRIGMTYILYGNRRSGSCIVEMALAEIGVPCEVRDVSLSDLAQRDRRALHLVEVEGLSYQEAGRILQVGRSNMKMIVFRSRRRIAKRMRMAMNAALFRQRRELGAA